MHRLLVPVLLLASCSTSGLGAGDSGDLEAPPMPVALGEPETPFEAAEVETGVPSELLVAISHVETGIQMVEGHEEFPGQPAAFGVMGLRGGNVTLGAELSGRSEEEVRSDRSANIFAAAHVLAAWAEQEGIDTTDLDAWAPVVARYSGIEDPDAAAEYVHREVYQALYQGIETEEVEVPPMEVNPDFPAPLIERWRHGEVGTVWTPSPNYNSRSGADPDFVVIHTCEGSYSGCWGWLANPASGVSAHYVVNDDGSEVRQLVDELDRAWHISADYDCANNDGVECWRNGSSMNTASVGIEHAGYASQSAWNSGLLQRSAELSCGITDRHGIPRDSYHIVGHGQLQPWNRSDPGAHWPWSDYLNRVKAACGDTGTAGTSTGTTGSTGSCGGSGSCTSSSPAAAAPFVIDSNNGANDTSKYYIEVSSNWWPSANVSGYWNTGYWVAPTDAISDPASFWFHQDATQCYTVEAWWPAASDRPEAITFLGWDPSHNEVGRATVNQQTGGSQWNHLGDWEFPAGWSRVLLSRWTGAGAYAIADAVRLTPSSACP